LAPRAKRRMSWTILRRLVQALALLAFIAFFVWSRRGGWPGSVVNASMRLDPLAMLAHLLASRTILIGSALALITLALTLCFGRVWCGWLCPLGTLLDLFSLGWWRGKRDAPPDSWRMVKYGLLLTLIAAALFANLTLMIFDPLTILFRTLSVTVWPAVDQLVTVAEATAYQIPALRSAVSTFDGLVRPRVLPVSPVFYRYTVLYAGVFLGVILLNLVASRFWCRYLCPLGALLGLVSKVAILRRKVNERCQECDACARVCPTGTIQPERGYASDPGARCVSTVWMPAPTAPSSSGLTSRRPSRRHTIPVGGKRSSHLALPPWASLWPAAVSRLSETIHGSFAHQGRWRTTCCRSASAADSAFGPVRRAPSNPVWRRQAWKGCGRRCSCPGWGTATTPATRAARCAPCRRFRR